MDSYLVEDKKKNIKNRNRENRRETEKEESGVQTKQKNREEKK